MWEQPRAVNELGGGRAPPATAYWACAGHEARYAARDQTLLSALFEMLLTRHSQRRVHRFATLALLAFAAALVWCVCVVYWTQVRRDGVSCMVARAIVRLYVQAGGLRVAMSRSSVEQDPPCGRSCLVSHIVFF